MEQGEQQQDPRLALAERLQEAGARAFGPDSDAGSRGANVKAFDELVRSTGTMALIPALNLLIQPGRASPALRTKFMGILTTIPLRKDGVRGTLEFVFSVHPSSTVGNAEAAVPRRQGANITHEALAMATRLLGNPPAGMSPDKWFPGIAPQLLALLDGRDGLELIKVASYVVGFGILGRKQFGAPGTAGWKAFAEPMLRPLNPSLRVSSGNEAARSSSPDGVIDLRQSAAVVSAADLAAGLHQLQALLLSHPNPGLSRRLLSPVLLSLWALGSWIKPSAQCEERYSLPARNLLTIYLKISSSPDKVKSIIQNLLYRGERKAGPNGWLFEVTGPDDIQIVAPKTQAEGATGLEDLDVDEIDTKAEVLLDLLESISVEDDISSVFLDLFSRWLATSEKGKKPDILLRESGEEAEDPMIQLLETSVLQKMMDKFPEKLVNRADNILELVDRVFCAAEPARDDETVAVALSLLNLVVTAPSFRRRNTEPGLLASLENGLERLGEQNWGGVSDTARNLSLFIKYRDDLEEPSESKQEQASDRPVEDRKTYSLAISYITQADSPAPVRSEGMNLISGLIVADSPILDIPAILVLMSSLLEDNDDYINLRVVKIFTQLADKHPKTATRELLERYVDAKEKSGVDVRLRFGEALLQVIERLGETFAGDTAQQVAETLLATAGRRGYRPKTSAKKERADRLKKMRNEEAEEAWDGEVPALGDEMTEEELDKNQILKRIVEGWESKRGAEDIRIRGSALSILAVGVETNIGGIGADLVSAAVDLCLSILTMEPELEKGILRRSAILLVLSFVRALDQARQTGKRLGFGLTEESQADILRILRYVAGTDNDGLVKQHADDVIESLENWQMTTLVPEARDTQGQGISRLAGLSVHPEDSIMTSSGPRPRIEEIE